MLEIARSLVRVVARWRVRATRSAKKSAGHSRATVRGGARGRRGARCDALCGSGLSGLREAEQHGW